MYVLGFVETLLDHVFRELPIYPHTLFTNVGRGFIAGLRPAKAA